jgi:hypothetical protein
MMAIVQRLKPDADTEFNPRAVLGGNNPPLDEQVTIDFVEALDAAGISKRIADLLASASRAPAVIADAEMAGSYADLVKQMVAAGKAVEAEREKLNRPLLNAQRALKGKADAIASPLGAAEATARARIRAFDAEQQRIEDQRRREAEDAARRAQQEADARAAEATAAGQPVEVAPIVEIAPAPVEAAVIRGDLGAKVSRVEQWKHEIISVRQLPDSILTHAKVVEALDKVIAAQVRGGLREMKGCRIYSETGMAIR